MTQPEQEAREMQPREAGFDLVGRIIMHMRDDLGFVVGAMPNEDRQKFYALQDEAREWLIDEGAAIDTLSRPTAGIDREVVRRAIRTFVADQDDSDADISPLQYILNREDLLADAIANALFPTSANTAPVATAAKTGERGAWRPISTAPKDGTEVLLFTDSALLPSGHLFKALENEPFTAMQIGYWQEEVDAPLCKEPAGWRTEKIGVPTHWQPLPDAKGGTK